MCVTPDEGGALGQEEVPCEEQPSESLWILKDHGGDPKLGEVAEAASPRQSAAGDKSEIEIESIDRHVAVAAAAAGGNSEVYACENARKPRKTIGHFEFCDLDDYVVKYAGWRRLDVVALDATCLHRGRRKADIDFDSSISVGHVKIAVGVFSNARAFYRDYASGPSGIC